MEKISRILVVDDDKDLLRISKKFLTREIPEFEFHTVQTAKEALQKLKSEKFDAIISDYQMPDMDGLELLKGLRQKGISSPFIMFTGRGREEVAIKALNMGADYYLRKDDCFASLYSELAHILRGLVHHKHTEEAFHASEERFRRMAENIRDGLLITENEKLVYINERLCAITGYSKEALQRMTARDLAIPEEKERIEQLHQDYLKGIIPTQTVEYWIQRKDGSHCCLENRYSYYKEKGRVVSRYIITSDITERKQAVDALMRSETRFRNIFANSPIGMLLCDAKGTITMANKAALDMCGVSNASELVGINIFDDPHMTGEIGQQLLQKKTRTYSIPVDFDSIRGINLYPTTRTGKAYFDVSFTPATLGENQGEGTLIQIQDITKEKQTADGLQESETRFRNIFANSPIGMLLCDAKGTITMANKAALDMFGVSNTSELVGLSIFDDPHMTEELSQQLFQKKTLRYSTPFDFDNIRAVNLYPTTRTGKAYFDVSITPVALGENQGEGTLIQVQDITKREELEHIVNHSPAVVFLWQNATGWPVEFVSENVKQFGFTPDDFYSGKTRFADIIHPDDLDRVSAEVSQYSQDGYSEFVQEYRIIAKTRVIRWLDDRTWVRRDSEGTITHYQGIVLDITERKQAERHLLNQKEELSEFTHVIAHDLRNRLLAIQGYTELLQDKYDPILVDKINKNIKTMTAVLRRSVTLANAGLVIEKNKEVNLDQVVREVANTIILPDITYLQDKLPGVLGDREKIYQIFQNLFENAIIHGAPKIIEVRFCEVANGFTILISNDGNPIPPKHRSQVFYQGFTTKKEPGRGLGLTIVQKIVNAHNWTIQLLEESQTTFCIFVPVENRK